FPSSGWTAASCGGSSKISQPWPASTDENPRTSRKKARSAVESLLYTITCAPKIMNLLLALAFKLTATARSIPLGGCFIGIAPESGAGLGGELRAAAFNEVARFGDDVFQNVCQLPDARLAVDDLRC